MGDFGTGVGALPRWSGENARDIRPGAGFSRRRSLDGREDVVGHLPRFHLGVGDVRQLAFPDDFGVTICRSTLEHDLYPS